MATLVPFYPTLADEVWPGITSPAPVYGTLAPRPPPVVRFATDAPRWNILWIVLDGWRADAMAPDLTPTVGALGSQSAVFQPHPSGGNAARYRPGGMV